MARVAGHLSVEALEARYEACADVTSSRHFQTIWLLAKGHSTGDVAAMTSFGQRWIEQLLERYNAFGPSALRDLRRGNGAPARVLTPELLRRLRVRLGEPPPDGGVWTSGKVARWMAAELGLASVAPQRGWEALRAIDWSIQKPRPRMGRGQIVRGDPCAVRSIATCSGKHCNPTLRPLCWGGRGFKNAIPDRVS